MDVRIQISGDDSGDLASLAHWLGDERELRGDVRQVPAPIKETELGGIPDLLTVALSAGAVTALARSLTTWLQTRRTTAKLTVKANGRTTVLDIESVHDVQALLEQVVRGSDDG